MRLRGGFLIGATFSAREWVCHRQGNCARLLLSVVATISMENASTDSVAVATGWGCVSSRCKRLTTNLERIGSVDGIPRKRGADALRLTTIGSSEGNQYRSKCGFAEGPPSRLRCCSVVSGSSVSVDLVIFEDTSLRRPECGEIVLLWKQSCARSRRLVSFCFYPGRASNGCGFVDTLCSLF